MREYSNKRFGNIGEDIASSFLKKRGFQIVDRNYYAKKFGEIDIIALQNGILHFIEVKSTRRDFDPIYNITPKKLKKVINSATYYISNKGLDYPFCIDAVIIRGDDIEMIENITV